MVAVPFLDLGVQFRVIRDEFYERLNEVCETAAFVLSSHVETFESNFAVFCGARYCCGLNSGTDALLLVVRGMGIGRGDEVIMPVNTFFATAEAVCLAGATPVFVDINDDTKSMDPERISEKITPRTRAVMAVHLFGNPAPMGAVCAIAEDSRIAVIEDACQAHGAAFEGRRVGTFGAAAAFSFYPGKNLGAFGDAGALVTGDNQLDKTARMLRDHGSSMKYRHDHIGYNSRLDAVQAVVLDCKLKYLDRWNEARRENAGIYSRLLEAVPWIKVPRPTPGAEPVYHLYTVEITDPRIERDALCEYLRKNSIGCGIHYPFPLHLTGALSFLGGKRGEFPIAEKTMANHLSLPMYPELTEEMIEHVVSAIEAYPSRP